MGDHLQKMVSLELPHEYKALKMYPPWEKWIIPKPTCISSLITDALSKGEDTWNFFAHFKPFQGRDRAEYFFPDDNPPSFQVNREYYGITALDPSKGNMVKIMWNGMIKKEKKFWEAAAENHDANS